MLLRNINPSSRHINGTRYVADTLNSHLMFLRSESLSKKDVQLILPRMNCSIGKDDFPIPGFSRCHFPIRIYFAMPISKAQGKSISGTLGID